MGMAVLKLKVMPESPETDLESIKKEIEERLKKFDVKNKTFEEQPIAFGLIAVITTMALPEEKSTDEVVEDLLKIENVSSIDVIDYRRAFG